MVTSNLNLSYLLYLVSKEQYSMTISPKKLNYSNGLYGNKDGKAFLSMTPEGWKYSLENENEILKYYEQGHYEEVIKKALSHTQLRVKSTKDLARMDESYLAAYYYAGKSCLELNDIDSATGCFHVVYSQTFFKKYILIPYHKYLGLAQIELEKIADIKGKEYVDNYNIEQFKGFSKVGGGCFIATAAYGSALAPEVVTLKDFRDKVLLQSEYGKLFVSLYWFLPYPAAIIERADFLRFVTRIFLLMPIIRLLKLLNLKN